MQRTSRSRFMAVSFVWSAMFNQRRGPVPRAANLVGHLSWVLPFG
jgi:hypothetical protein